MAQNRARYTEALKRGNTALEQDNWKEAIGYFRIAVSEFPNEPEPYDGLGQACIGIKQLDKALDCYKYAARYSRGDITYLKRVADIQERLGQLSEAGRTYMAVGEILLRQGQLDEAIDHWLRAVGLESNLLGAHRRLATVFQRRGNTKGAVREYLAIARILQMRGEKENALQMCRAALRLDPDSKDVITAMELIKFGEQALGEEEEEEEDVPVEEPTAEEDDLTTAVRQMASIFESQLTKERPAGNSGSAEPIEFAKRLAQEQLAEEIFRDEEDEDLLYGGGGVGMSKLERDALIGQAMDFQTRGDTEGAIDCYSQAVNGGLNMPAAHFTLGLLYKEVGQNEDARVALETAVQDENYAEASQAILADL